MSSIIEQISEDQRKNKIRSLFCRGKTGIFVYDTALDWYDLRTLFRNRHTAMELQTTEILPIQWTALISRGWSKTLSSAIYRCQLLLESPSMKFLIFIHYLRNYKEFKTITFLKFHQNIVLEVIFRK